MVLGYLCWLCGDTTIEVIRSHSGVKSVAHSCAILCRFVMFPNAQDALPLPRRPNLELYKKLAKDLVKACKSDDKDATGEWAEKWATALAKQCGIEFIRPLPVIASRWTGQVAGFVQQKIKNGKCRLAEAQLILASSHGFDSWTRFSKHLDGLTKKTQPSRDFRQPRMQTLWSAGHGGDPKLYKEIIETLIAAGAKVPPRHVPVNQPIDDLLRRYGSEPEPTWYWYGEKP